MIEEYADVCPTTSWGAARRSEMTSDSVTPAATGRRLEKTSRLAVQGGEVTADAAGAVVEHPERNSTARFSFALFGLCKVGWLV